MKNKHFFFILLLIFTLNNKVYADNNSKTKNLFLKINKNIDRKFYFLDDEDEKNFNKIKNEIKNNKFFESYNIAKKIKNNGFKEAINIYITSEKYQSLENFSQQEIMELIEFNKKIFFLTVFEKFNKIIENYYLDDTISYQNVSEYFKEFKSKSVNVNIKLFKNRKSFIGSEIKEENKKIKENDLLNEQINYFWTSFNSTVEEENALFFNEFSSVIKDYSTISKIELRIFNKKDFTYLLKYLNNVSYKNMFEVINEIKKTQEKIDHLEKKINKNLLENESFLFSKVLYYRRIKDDKSIIKILLDLKENARFSKEWWIYRNMFTRDLIVAKEYKKAYIIVNGFNGPKGTEYSEAEWLAGWIAITYLKDNNLAMKHFLNFHNYVAYPQSISRGEYWIASTYKKMGNKKEAIKWFGKASKYSMTFYGQLSHYSKYNLLKENEENLKYEEMIFPILPEITANDIENLNNNAVVKLSFLYYKYIYDREEAIKIFNYLVSKKLKLKAEITEFINIVETFDDEPVIVSLSKQASYKMIFFLDHLFPILRMVKKNEENIAIIHAIIKQESGFVLTATSSAGAIGFMQVMPATAKALCKEMKITFNEYKLKNDPQYNITLGKYYIGDLIKKYNGSKIMAIAAYNAGPNAVRKWVDLFGDPRELLSVEDAVDWIESINYKETRNYVQRVLENLVIYEHKLEM